MLRSFHSRREMHRAQAVSLFCFWCTLYYILKQLSAYDAVLKDHSDLFASIGCCFVSMVSITFLGYINWPAVMEVDDGSSLFKKHPAAETLALLQFSFQLWDLFAAFYVPGFLKVEMVLHHGVSCLSNSQIYVYRSTFSAGLLIVNILKLHRHFLLSSSPSCS